MTGSMLISIVMATLVAGTLVLEESTIKTHVSSILSKLSLSSRVQAVIVAYEAGLVTPGTRARARPQP